MTLEEAPHISGEFSEAKGAIDAAGPVEDHEVHLTKSAEAEARDRVADEDNERKAKDKQAAPKSNNADPEEQHGPAKGPLPGFKPKYGSRHGIYDEDKYLRVKGLYKVDPRSGQKVPDTEKLKVALMAAIADKGWTDGIAIYRKNRIDQQLTSAAQSLLATDKALQIVMQKRGVGSIPCQQSLDPEHMPCWLAECDKPKHLKRCEEERRQSLKAGIASLKESGKKLKGFEKDENGKTVKDNLREARRELEAQVPGVTKRAFNAASDLLGKTAIGSAIGLGAGSAGAAGGNNSAGPAASPPPV